MKHINDFNQTNYVNQDIVPFDIALRIRELGFDAHVFFYYDQTDKELYPVISEHYCSIEDYVQAPDFNTVRNWLKDGFNILIYVYPFFVDNVYQSFKGQITRLSENKELFLIEQIEIKDEKSTELQVISKALDILENSQK